MSLKYWDRKKDDWVEREISSILTGDLEKLKGMAVDYRNKLEDCQKVQQGVESLIKGKLRSCVDISFSSEKAELSYRIRGTIESMITSCNPFPDDKDFDTFREKTKDELNGQIIEMNMELQNRK